jgi:hypothetical protein
MSLPCDDSWDFCAGEDNDDMVSLLNTLGDKPLEDLDSDEIGDSDYDGSDDIRFNKFPT